MNDKYSIFQSLTNKPSPIFDPRTNQFINVGDIPQQQAGMPQQKTRGRGGFLSSLISEAGGAGGAVGGAAIGTALLPGVGTLIGAGLGGLLGGTGGRVIENEVRDNRVGLGDALKEGALSGAFSLAGEGLSALKGARAASKLVKAGVGAEEAANAVKGGSGLVETLGKNLKSSAQGYGIGTRVAGEDIGAATSDAVGATLKKLGVPATSPEQATRLLEPRLSAMAQTLDSQYAKGARAIGKKDLDALGESILGRVQSAGGLGDTATNFANEQIGKLKNVKNTTDLWNFTKSLERNATNFASNPSSKLVEKEGAARIMRDEIRGLLNNSLPGVAETNNLYHDATIASDLLKKGAKDLKGGGLFGKLTNLAPVKAGEAKAGSVIENAGKIISNPVLKQARVQAPAGLARALSGLSSDQNDAMYSTNQAMDMNMTVPQNSVDSSSNIADSSSAGIDDLSTQGVDNSPSNPFDVANVDDNVQKIIANGGKMKDVSEYISLVDALQKIKAPAAGKKMNATQIQQANNSNSALADLQTIASTLQKDPKAAFRDAIPGGGLARRLTGTGDYEAARQNVADALGRLRSGGAINKDEEKRFLGLLPGAFDDPNTARLKLNRLASLFQSFADPQEAQPDYVTTGATL